MIKECEQILRHLNSAGQEVFNFLDEQVAVPSKAKFQIIQQLEKALKLAKKLED